MLECKCGFDIPQCDSALYGEDPAELLKELINHSWMVVTTPEEVRLMCPPCADEMSRVIETRGEGGKVEPSDQIETRRMVALLIEKSETVNGFPRTPPNYFENAEYVQKRALKLAGTKKSEPGWYHSKDGDCIFAYWEDVPSYADRINGPITVYRAVDDNRIVGCQLKGVEKEMG
jgi:hypothetical protein